MDLQWKMNRTCLKFGTRMFDAGHFGKPYHFSVPKEAAGGAGSCRVQNLELQFRKTSSPKQA